MIFKLLPIHNSLIVAIFLFPVMVTVSVAGTILCGGTCHRLHWWGCMVIALVIAFCGIRSDWKRRAISSLVCFGLYLLIIWLFTYLLFTNCGDDAVVCHLPATRMLIQGWNPFYQNTPETITESFGILPDMMKTWHVISYFKAVWYFNAAAYYFCNAPFNLQYPIVAALLYVSL